MGIELRHLARQMVGSSSIHVPWSINRVGLSMSMCSKSSLLIIPFAIVAKAKEFRLESSMTLGGDVAINAT
jgi:hypothetical protein